MKSNPLAVYIGLGAVVIFALVGAWLGTPPVMGSTFGDTLQAFAADHKTRYIVAAILADVITGVAAAIHIGTFQAQAIAKFHTTNVLPYLGIYLLLWALQVFGLGDALPAPFNDALTSVSFGTIVTTLGGSILNNVGRLRAPIVYTHVSDNYADKPSNTSG